MAFVWNRCERRDIAEFGSYVRDRPPGPCKSALKRGKFASQGWVESGEGIHVRQALGARRVARGSGAQTAVRRHRVRSARAERAGRARLDAETRLACVSPYLLTLHARDARRKRRSSGRQAA